MPYRTRIASPLGPLEIACEGATLTRLTFSSGTAAITADHAGPTPAESLRTVERLAAWLERYFAGDNPAGDFELAPAGTPFQRAVWTALRTIPYGATASYADIARSIGQPSAVRAVGAANGRNPIAILIPCHRVVGSDGSLTGYAGGLERKRALLALEHPADLARVA
jgi:methylated-DNA-[protein]-cysteine S-methyltransferase